MPARLKSIRIQNYRSLADVSLDLGPINVLFGPSGAGKSSLLDAIGFFRDCASRGVEFASAKRGHGVGLPYDGASPNDPIRLDLMTDRLEYELTLGLSSGRIDPLVGERLYSTGTNTVLIERSAGTAKAKVWDVSKNEYNQIDLREPPRLILSGFPYEWLGGDAFDLLMLLLSGGVYHSRSLKLSDLKRTGSAAGSEIGVMERGENLWSVLRNLEGRRLLDHRYATIMRYMAEAFPAYKGLIIEPTGPTVLYARFLEKDRREPILASGISDGHLQFLILLTVLFFDDGGGSPLVLFDEPETSLHPWALAVLAKAIRDATTSWGRQVILATHSPVLISQFDTDQQLAVESRGGRTRITRVSEIEDIQDLLEDYSTGSLYMAEAVAPQSMPIEPSTSGR